MGLEPGIYERLVTNELAEQLQSHEPELLRRARLHPSDAHDVLARHIAALTRRALRAVADRTDDQATLSRELALANRIVAAIAQMAGEDPDPQQVVTSAEELLTAILAHRNAPEVVRPETPLWTSALLVNGRGQPSVGAELRKEIASADKVDLICAFVTWAGVRIFEQVLQDLGSRGGQLRVITTTYLGATDRRALDRLVALGAQLQARAVAGDVLGAAGARTTRSVPVRPGRLEQPSPGSRARDPASGAPGRAARLRYRAASSH